MARFITRIADLCRQRAAEEQFLRRFRMMRIGEEEADGGPGWYESSRELERGLLVREDGLLDDWLDALQRAAPAAS
jgi:hypothetical protein